MIRGTTAQFKFKLPYTKNELDWVTIKFWQPNNTSSSLPITKTLTHCSATNESKELCVSLTANETRLFLDTHKAIVQFRAQHKTNGTIFGSRPEYITVYPMLDDIIIENPVADGVESLVIFDGDAIPTTE